MDAQTATKISNNREAYEKIIRQEMESLNNSEFVEFVATLQTASDLRMQADEQVGSYL
jgi:hypothetical protein